MLKKVVIVFLSQEKEKVQLRLALSKNVALMLRVLMALIMFVDSFNNQ